MEIKNTQNLDYYCSFPYKRIRIFPDRDLRATLLELSMIDTRIMQRLRNTKQLGNSNVSYPTAEHSRFSHSLGVLYWSTKILSSLSDNHNAACNKSKLDELNTAVKGKKC
jgi:HD superfamily phosphohydrolase